MSISIYQVDSFATQPFEGNPAGVCPLAQPKDDSWMQSVAAEMNLAETAFLVKRDDGYDLRWFTPTTEVDLCGHATLASAHILWETGSLAADEQARFHTRSGLLTADRVGDEIELDFPSNPPKPVEPPSGMMEALGVAPAYVGRNQFDYLVEVDREAVVRGVKPDFRTLQGMGVRGFIVTSASTGRYDFISRFFAPGAGIDEDPVTGSAHCALAPYWAAKLNKDEMVGFQASRRGGQVRVRVQGDRVRIAGRAITVLSGALYG